MVPLRLRSRQEQEEHLLNQTAQLVPKGDETVQKVPIAKQAKGDAKSKEKVALVNVTANSTDIVSKLLREHASSTQHIDNGPLECI